NFSQYIVSYLRYRTGERDLTNVDALWVVNSGKPTQCIGMVVGGFLFQSGSVLLSYFAVQKSFIAFVFTYGIMFGFGTSCTYASPLTSAVKWLPNRPGLAGGFIVAGYGAGASIFNQIITQYINPDNKIPDIIEGSDSRMDRHLSRTTISWHLLDLFRPFLTPLVARAGESSWTGSLSRLQCCA
ncbi:hypothetical protein CHS0354_041442, partial [Potamilus streckersoni]